MSNKIHSYICLGAFIWIIMSIVPNTGCQFRRSTVSQVAPLPYGTGNIFVLGFRPAVHQGGKSGVIRSPLSGAVFMAEPIPPGIPDKMTDQLFSRLMECEGYELIGPGKASGFSETLLSSDQVMSDMETFKRIGFAFSADAVMVGYIYRWQERKGSDYSVESPASAAFDLYLLRSEDGAILWKTKFDKTQTPLSENIFDFITFFKGKGKWMTVENLAYLGLTELLDSSLQGECK
ncbi:hypothetical protein OAC89_01735 [Deltaproteobacteria bacterium]|nr:hypothetical protein [Deltaproteobacteria bacterium]